jgi:hypothetical protein
VSEIHEPVLVQAFASPAGLPLFWQHHLQRVEVQRLLRHDLPQPSVLFLHLTQPPGLVHFQAPVLRLPVVERGITDADPAAEVLHGDSGLRFFQHLDDLLSLKRLLFMALLLSWSYTRRSYVLAGVNFGEQVRCAKVTHKNLS